MQIKNLDKPRDFDTFMAESFQSTAAYHGINGLQFQDIICGPIFERIDGPKLYDVYLTWCKVAGTTLYQALQEDE